MRFTTRTNRHLYIPDMRGRRRQVIERAIGACRRDLTSAADAHTQSTATLLSLLETRARQILDLPDTSREDTVAKIAELDELHARFAAACEQIDQTWALARDYLSARLAELAGKNPPCKI
jgi:hypothetical protein